jgi:hypothetical protein
MSSWEEIGISSNYLDLQRETLGEAAVRAWTKTKYPNGSGSNESTSVGEYMKDWLLKKERSGMYDNNQAVRITANHVASTNNFEVEEVLSDFDDQIEVLSMTVMFTKKHYLKVGESIGRAIVNINKNIPAEKREEVLKGLSIIVSQLAEDFKEDNPRFKREDFLKSLTPPGK